jgi:hypothetical protein
MVDLITGGRTKPNSRTQLLKQDDQRHNLICRCKLILPPSVDRHCFSTQPLQAHRSQQEGWLSGSCVAPEGAEGLDGAGPEDVLVVEGRDGRADEGADPEDPLPRKRVGMTKPNHQQVALVREWKVRWEA